MFTGNTASSEGGGLWNSATGTMTVVNSDVVGNSANGTLLDNGGGGLFNDGGLLRVRGGTVAGNLALVGSGSGGGILNNLGEVYLTGVVVKDNSAARAGGGIEANAGYTSVIASRPSGNSTGSAPGNGGGLHVTGAGTVEIDRSLVIGNTAVAEGGGV